MNPHFLCLKLLLKPHQCSPQCFLTLRLLEALTTNISDIRGVFCPKKSFWCSQTLPCCKMLPRFACLPSFCSFSIPCGICRWMCRHRIGFNDLMNPLEGGCCCSSWGKCGSGGRGRLGEVGCDRGWELGWVRLGWVKLGWAVCCGHLEQDQVLPVPSLQTETSQLAEVNGCCSTSAPVQHFLCLYKSRNLSFLPPQALLFSHLM